MWHCKAVENGQTLDRYVYMSKTYAVWFGKPDTGMPIPVEQINAVRRIIRFWGEPGIFAPTSLAIGTRRTLAMV